MQQQHPSRRNFLKTTGLALAASNLAANSLAAGKPSKWTVTCRDVHLPAAAQPDCWAAAKYLGIDGIEAAIREDMALPSLKHPEHAYTLATDDGLKFLQEQCAKAGVAITGFCMSNRLDQQLDKEVEWTRRLAKAADALGATAIRIDISSGNIKAEEVVAFSINACKRMCQAVEGTGVRLGIENHGRWTNDPAILQQIFDGVGSDKLGLTMDFMNFYWFGHPLNNVYSIIEKFAPRAVHTHCKNLRYPDDQKNIRRAMGWQYAKYAAPLYEGDIDYARVAGILRRAGYSGDLCLENECLGHFPKDQQPDVLKKEIALLRSLA